MRGRPARVIRRRGRRLIHLFCRAGNITKVTDPDNNVTTYRYDPAGRPYTETDPLGHTDTKHYDGDNNLISETDRDGRTRVLQYDAQSREAAETWYAADGVTVTNVKQYTYDTDGNALTAGDYAGTYTMTYDALGRLHTQTGPNNVTLTYQYDAAGNVTNVHDSLGGTATSTYDAGGRLQSRTFTDGTTPLREELTYDPDGNQLTATRYSDLAGTVVVGSSAASFVAGRMTHLTHRDGGGNVLADFAYSYDPGGRLTSESDSNSVSFTITYTYDASDQLKQAVTTGYGSGTIGYGYDPNGNRTMAGYQTGSGNRLLSDGTWTYTYDNEGNVVGKVDSSSNQSWAYTYDNANQLTSATWTWNGQVQKQATYTYDVFGRRIEKSVVAAIGPDESSVSHFVYDGDSICAVLDDSGQVVTRNLHADAVDQVFGEVESGQVIWGLTDRLGSLRLVWNDQQREVTETLDYDAFGNVTYHTIVGVGDGPQLPVWSAGRYAGYQYDSETDLYDDGARYYNTATGQFMSQDPLGLGPDSNPYRYVGNGPTNGTDPTGLREADDRLNARTKNLVDVADILERHVNQVVQKAWDDAKAAGDGPKAFVRRIYEQLGANEPNSGVKIGVAEVSPVAKIGVWLDSTLSERKNQIVKLLFAQSRYGDNPLVVVRPLWLVSNTTANHGLAPTIRVKGTLMGTDKWEHFFQQGFWIFDRGMNYEQGRAYSEWLEGAPNARGALMDTFPGLPKKWGVNWDRTSPAKKHLLIDEEFRRISKKYGVTTGEGIYGFTSTGVISHADVNANLAGADYYRKLFGAYRDGAVNPPRFSVGEYRLSDFNEQTIKNTFAPWLLVNDNK